MKTRTVFLIEWEDNEPELWSILRNMGVKIHYKHPVYFAYLTLNQLNRVKNDYSR